MRLATLRAPGRPDGSLAVVSDDMRLCRRTAWTLQQALDDWDTAVAQLAALPPGDEAFTPADCLAPLPRAYQFLDASAYLNHVELVRRARGVAMPESFWRDPLMYQGGSDGFLAPLAPITGAPDWGIDMEGEVAVITGAVPRGADRATALSAIRLVMLLNDVSLRNLIPAELAKGFGFVQSKPASACSPLAVTPDALEGWQGGTLHGVLRVDLNGQPFGRADAGRDMTFDFPALIVHAAKTRDLAAGTIIGSGTVSNRGADGAGPGRPVSEGGAGYSCISEQRMVETIATGAAKTPFLQPGDRVKLWMQDSAGRQVFGAIEQTVRGIGE